MDSLPEALFSRRSPRFRRTSLHAGNTAIAGNRLSGRATAWHATLVLALMAASGLAQAQVQMPVQAPNQAQPRVVGSGAATAANAPAAPTGGAHYSAIALEWARENAAAHAPAAAAHLALDVSVGAMDSRLKLAACGAVEPYLPPGSRLWGRSRLGLRCVDGMSRWNVTLPVTVKAMGPAWVVKGQVASGAVLTEADGVLVDVDWAEESAPVLSDSSQWVGMVATRALSSGQVLRQGAVRPSQVFQAGASVRVVAQGRGFQITGEGQAVSVGVVGQPARVRLDNGRITTGTVVDARTVKIEI